MIIYHLIIEGVLLVGIKPRSFNGFSLNPVKCRKSIEAPIKRDDELFFSLALVMILIRRGSNIVGPEQRYLYKASRPLSPPRKL